jgi:oxygen-independent coproporphyrinogen-3 oxidase
LAEIQPALQGHPIAELLAEERIQGAVDGLTALYVHVPFCRQRCPYCNFSTAAYTARGVGRFVDAVGREAAALAPLLDGVRFETLFLGGGTPSRLDPPELRRLLAGLRTAFRFVPGGETTLEANPEDIDPGRLESWLQAGINRISLGVQSLHDDELARLGRRHGADGARLAMQAVGDSFDNWSADLMFGFPGHGEVSWRQSLAGVLAEKPPHLALYQFTAEAGTVTGDAIRAGNLRLPEDEETATLYDAARAACREHGLEHYEISNFARPGFRSAHNTAYWRRRPYLGLGPAAVSQCGDRRWTNLLDSGRYGDAVLAGVPWVGESESLQGKEILETVMLGLRLEDGLRWRDLPGTSMEIGPWREAAAVLAGQGLLAMDEEAVRIREDHRGVADGVILRLWEEAGHRETAGVTVDTEPGPRIE